MSTLSLRGASLRGSSFGRGHEKNAVRYIVTATRNLRKSPGRSSKSTIMMAAPLSSSAASSSSSLETTTTTSSPSSSSTSSAEQQQRDAATASTVADSSSFFSKGDTRPILLYDAKCNLCNGGVDVARALDGRGDAARLRFAALQSPAGRALLVSAAGRSPDDISSVVLVESPTRAFVRSEAVVRAAKVIGAPAAVLAAALAGPIPLSARDRAYDAVADNRYNVFGKSQEEKWTRKGEPEGRFLVE